MTDTPTPGRDGRETNRVLNPAARGPVQGLADLAEMLDERHTSATFVRGVVIGALVGAAIAGSAIWQRRRRKPRG